jgi:hypothetical protein
VTQTNIRRPWRGDHRVREFSAIAAIAANATTARLLQILPHDESNSSGSRGGGISLFYFVFAMEETIDWNLFSFKQ